MNLIGIVGFSKNIFNSIFGFPILNQNVVCDLTKREFYLLSFMITGLILLNSLTLLF